MNAENERQPAAVLVPLFIKPDIDKSSTPSVQLKGRNGFIDIPLSANLLFTVRTNTVEHHKGQISFPGGRAEDSDGSLEATALRETQEEIGLDPQNVQIVAELPDMPTMASRFLVRPYVGIIRSEPHLVGNPDEIEEILFVPLAHLLDPKNSVTEYYEGGGKRYRMKTYYFNSHRIWGVTGAMVQVLLEKYFKC